MQRFWEKVARDATSKCWPWTGNRFPNGYGYFWLEGKGKQAHRVAFFLVNGFWPEVVRHACDNPPCCNPDHLRAGSQQDNIADAAQRDRRATGDKHPMSKLTQAKADEIRRRLNNGERTKALASEYGVSYQAIYDIKTNVTWR